MSMFISKEQEDQLAERITESLGFASVCWDPRPTGIFQSDLVFNDFNMLCEDIFEILNIEVVDRKTCDVCGGEIKVSIFRNSPYCCELCRKRYVQIQENEETQNEF